MPSKKRTRDKVSNRLSDVAKPPKDTPWIWHTVELYESDAWLGRSLHCVKLIARIEQEHLEHGGSENGNLIVTYSDFENYGLSRRYIKKAIQEAEGLGLIYVEWGKRRGYAKNYLHRFTLTYYAIKKPDNHNKYYYICPTNDWQRVKHNDVQVLHQRLYGKLNSMCKMSTGTVDKSEL